MRLSLCDQCENYDRDKVRDLQATWKMRGWKPFDHVWCKVMDRPEDKRWYTCPEFEEKR